MIATLHSEWTKFRTVRGWVIGIVLAMLVTALFSELGSQGCSVMSPGPHGTTINTACPGPTLGPGGLPVDDDFYFVHQTMPSSGTITVRVTSLTGTLSGSSKSGLQPWSKAGIIIKASTKPGSAYAAMMVTGSNGVRFQWNFANDTAGLTGRVSAASPRWLRLVRAGSTITGYDSLDGTHWDRVGSAVLTGLPSTAQSGMFATSPGATFNSSSGLTGSSGGTVSTLDSATMDHVSLSWQAGRWTGTAVGNIPSVPGPVNASPGGYQASGGTFTVSGSGDIVPDNQATGGSWQTIQNTLAGAFPALIAVVVVGALFITAEYRRGLIRLTLVATPRRGRMLAAKAIVIGAVTFVVALIGVAGAVIIGVAKFHSEQVPLVNLSTLTDIRIVAGTAALLAVSAVLALAIGMMIRRSAVAVASVIVVMFVPVLLGTSTGLLPGGAQEWLMRLTPASAFSIEQAFPAFNQVADGQYTPNNGYYPLAPWAGFGVLCAWTVAALALAFYLLRRRDA
jgi:ABC-type transport system involved in multi-copper enzyme maturation permease subunit